MLPILLLIGMAAIQLGIVGYTANQAGTAARAAARTEALEPGTGAAAGRDAVSGWLQGNTRIAVGGGDTISATATVTVPSVLPGIHLFGPVHRTVTMPNDTTAAGATARDSTARDSTARNFTAQSDREAP
ncbi:TadE/TadG family type IV pilus assembly protein [Streptomyces sp. NPDC059398]|uniref:TadE/TadG family type IV pilus assembly protein n=1 Tax=Streptomyces sp. NPDC059398 TaxID=3346820 RepID=UPI0036B4890A